MKKIIMFSVIGLVAGSALFTLASCGKSAQPPAEEAASQAAQNAVPNPSENALTPGDTYICSMHPEVTSGTPGKCPKCGMDLVLRSELNEENSSESMPMSMPMNHEEHGQHEHGSN